MKASIIPNDNIKNRVVINTLLRGAIHVSDSDKRLIAHIPVHLIKVDHRYQREIKHNALINRWDPDKSSIITLSYRKGEPDVFYLIDGQHRVDAARKKWH